MEKWLLFTGTILASVVGSGVFVLLVQRRFNKADKRTEAETAGTQAILTDGTNIRHELWKELGQVRGELKAVQTQQATGLEERYQLKMAIKSLEKSEEECREELAKLRARVAATEYAQRG